MYLVRYDLALISDSFFDSLKKSDYIDTLYLQESNNIMMHVIDNKGNKISTVYFGMKMGLNILYSFKFKFTKNKIKPLSLQIFIDELLLADYVKNGKTIPYRKFLFKSLLLHVQAKLINVNDLLRKLIKPVNYDLETTVKTPQLLKDAGTTLYKYQKESLKWMLNIEHNKPQITIPNPNFIKIQDIVIDPYIGRFYIGSQINSLNLNETISFSGGALIDATGLGKTITCMSLAISNPCKDTDFDKKENVSTGTCQGIFVTGSKKNQICHAKIKDKGLLYCKKHISQQKDTPPQTNLFIYDQSHFKSKATLIICPNQLPQQWKDELLKHSNNKLQIVLISTKNHFIKYSFKDLVHADFVIVTADFLNNNNYKETWQEYDMNNIRNDFDTPIKTMAMELTRNKDILNVDSAQLILFNAIHWHRIIIDEGHEYLSRYNTRYFDYIISNLDASYKWYVSGTPFPEGLQSYYHILKIISNGVNDPSLLNIKDVSTYIEKLFRRNTKDSVEKEFSLPSVKKIVKWLDFSNTERSMYNSYKTGNQQYYVSSTNYSLYLQQLCCHPNLSEETRQLLGECKSLSEIQSIMSSHYKKDLEKCKSLIDLKKQRLILAKNQVDYIEQNPGQLSQYEENKIKREHEIAKKDLETAQITFKNKKEGLNYLEKATKEIDQKIEECPICLDDIPEGEMGVTSCCHKFCWGCLTSTDKCAICRTPLNNSNIFKVKSSNKDSIINPPNVELLDLINTHGTKMAHLILYLKKMISSTDDKAIVFSQWDDLLHKVGHTLNIHKINNCFCRGSVHQRNKAINLFNKSSTSKNYRIIMLSTKNAASGINLTKANRIILLEPIYGSADYSIDIEKQVIGRTHRIGQKKEIVIVKFLIKNTVEEDFYNSVFKDDPVTNQIDLNYLDSHKIVI